MVNLLIADYYKKICTIKNDKSHFFIGIVFNILIIVYMSFNINKDKDNNLYFYFLLLYAIIWLTFSALTQANVLISNEIKNYTVNNLILSPYGLKKIIFSRLFCDALISITMFMLLLIIPTKILRISIPVSILELTFIIVIGLISVYSIGIILGFISLLSKNISMITTIVKIIMLYSIITFKENVFIPFSFTKTMIVDIFINNYSLSNFDHIFFIKTFISSFLYLLLSIVFSNYIENKAFKIGKFIS